ncbi:hypothetical protein GN244_ATG10900 [Phytophthora infestans]|uniref:Crinkler (CRN) family protein n=1 Tax=Phytophthora infestans TaxID=4787 RepID=A0A833T107_PHYIN|nr:hypothetical protein GN244_ATG10900 [Phytophthora infestans]
MNLIEDNQKNEYRKYVEDNFGEDLQAKKLCVFGVENTTDILRDAVEGSNIELRGRTDLLLLSDNVMESADYVHDLPEAMSELIALELMATDPVVALLTDFSDDWRLFWLSRVLPSLTAAPGIDSDASQGLGASVVALGFSSCLINSNASPGFVMVTLFTKVELFSFPATQNNRQSSLKSVGRATTGSVAISSRAISSDIAWKTERL